MSIYNVKERVKQILQDYPQTRNSDELLISMVDTDINPQIAAMPYWVVMQNRKKYGLPSCESVRRARQVIQANNPELAATDRVRKYRKELEPEYKELARSKT